MTSDEEMDATGRIREGERVLDIAEVAAAAGISVDTVRYYHKHAIRHRARGTDDGRTLPAPLTAGRDGLTWGSNAISAWIDRRQAPRKPGPVSRDVIREIIAALDNGQIAKARTIATEAL